MRDGFYNIETYFEKRLFNEGDEVLIEAPWTDNTRYDAPQCSAIEDAFLNKIKKYNYNFVNMSSTFCQYLSDTYHVSGVDLEFLFYLVFSAHSYGVKVGAENVTKIMQDLLSNGGSDNPSDLDEDDEDRNEKEYIVMKNITDFCIGCDNSTGICCESKEEFLQRLGEEIDRIDVEGKYAHFDIKLEPNND